MEILDDGKFSWFLNNLYESLLDREIEKFKKNTDLLLNDFFYKNSDLQMNISDFFKLVIEKIGLVLLFRYTRTYTEEHPILYFIEKGMDVNVQIKNNFGDYNSLLQLSSAYSNFLLCRNLIDKKININTDDCEVDALYSACIESENMDIIELLLKNGANPNKKYIKNQEYTILHILVTKISYHVNFFNGGLILNMIATLLKYGADPYLKDYYGKTSIDVCDPLDVETYKKIILNSEEIRRFYICEN